MKKNVRLLLTEKDREALKPLLAQLEQKGLTIGAFSGKAETNDTVLAAMSEAFYADDAAVEKLLGLIAAGAENVLPLQLDGAPMPDALKNALYARNIIATDGRDAAHTAERILAALPKKKSRLPLLLTVGAVVLAAILGLVIWRAAQDPGTVSDTADEAELVYPIPEGITAEDLAKIEAVIIVGEQAEFYDRDTLWENNYQVPAYDLYVYRDYDDDGPHWYSREDGHPYAMTRYEDLRFLELMPNLRGLTLTLVDAGQVPQLGALKRLETVNLLDCRISDLDWLSGAQMKDLFIENVVGVTDYSPLTSCGALSEVMIDLGGSEGNRQADFSGFCPENLKSFRIRQGYNLPGGWELPRLQNCKNLRDLELQGLPIRDLSCVEGMDLQTVRLNDLERMSDISALGGMGRLQLFECSDCERLDEYSPLHGCANLTSIRIERWGENNLTDASFLTGLAKLRNIELCNVNLPNLDFLRDISQGRQQDFELRINGYVEDLSALEAIISYRDLELDFMDRIPAEQAFSYLSGTKIDGLTLRHFSQLDLSSMPKVSGRLRIESCGLTDLSTLPETIPVPRIELCDCSRLSSLNGLQKMPDSWKLGIGNLRFDRCPRLVDWSALDGVQLGSLEIENCYTIPSFENLRVSSLGLYSIPDLTDISFLDAMQPGTFREVELVGLDELTSLEPLRRFRGFHLAVPPHLAEQAAILVEDGVFSDYRVEYPQGGWSLEQADFALESLDELKTLPKALLRHVTSVCLAGDQVIDPDEFEIREDWEQQDRDGHPALLLFHRRTGEEIKVQKGVITDLGVFSELTGLRSLCLYGQPIKSLDGIQAFSELEEFRAQCCTALTDASALFAVQSLHRIDLQDTAVSSIQGIQNLTELWELNLSNSKVSDLSLLSDCDFSAAEREGGGLDLNINNLPQSAYDFEALGTVRRYSNLSFADQDPALWIPALADSEIASFGAAGDFCSNEDLAAFAADHPELRNLYIGNNQAITDLRCLLSIDNLEWVMVNRQMTEAIASLGGQAYSFELEIEG